MATSRNPAELREVWEGWHAIAAADAERLHAVRRAVEQGRAGAGFRRHRRAVALEVRHAAGRVRRRSWTACGIRSGRSTCRFTPTCACGCTRSMATRSRRTGPIPAHMLGNIWAQDWSNVYPLVAPATSDPGYSLDRDPAGRKMTSVDMAKHRRALLHVAGLRAAAADVLAAIALRQAARSRRRVPRQRVGHRRGERPARQDRASNRRPRTSSTIHHELGHNFYQRAYNTLPLLFRDSANDGFHEAVGDTIALSVTPEYLVKIGLLDKAPPIVERHRPAARASARQGRLPAVRTADRPVALAGLLGPGHARALQRGVVGAAA